MKLLNTLKGLTLSLVLCMSAANAGVIESWNVDFNALSNSGKFSAMDGQNKGSMSIKDTTDLYLTTNSWYYLSLEDIIGQSSLSLDETDSDIILSFDFKPSNNSKSEITGIQTSNVLTAVSSDAFNLFGTQNWGKKEFSYTANDEFQHFEINLDQYLSGSFSKIVFINDCDNTAKCTNGADASSATFSNMTISKVPEPTTVAILGLGLLGLVASRKRKL